MFAGNSATLGTSSEPLQKHYPKAHPRSEEGMVPQGSPLVSLLPSPRSGVKHQVTPLVTNVPRYSMYHLDLVLPLLLLLVILRLWGLVVVWGGRTMRGNICLLFWRISKEAYWLTISLCITILMQVKSCIEV